MTAIRVFDRAMCCSTGVCGPSVDPQLARFSADLDWLKNQGVAVERFNLSQQPGAFADDETVKAALETKVLHERGTPPRTRRCDTEPLNPASRRAKSA